jgi:hypothetical protein
MAMAYMIDSAADMVSRMDADRSEDIPVSDIGVAIRGEEEGILQASFDEEARNEAILTLAASNLTEEEMLERQYDLVKDNMV